ncbi:adenylyl-sulfate kinase [Alicyclobacillus cycloheptanicus]|uniref:Adenylyl-sulfate kinase n=1 Tax=Alicyclobacillus cycloheptanicus TaxID=1457 RepID=A0ABT9XM82_9BACL|nr:adenylyl-sulfate kinase [Alicyclobacillus cycloheptanicus]MDQ0191407.1 adenylylsulfate kinase [Alicyclobacillus cycloheptanicus]
MSSQRIVVWNETPIQKADRRKRNGHHSFVLWLTGLSGAGKSTLANHLQAVLFEQGVQAYLLDGDNLRMGLNRDLGFSAEDRKENVRRVAEVAKLFVDAGMVVITALISPYQSDRDEARARYEEDEFVEVFVDCRLEVCQQRDPKGLYQKALRGEITNFTGVQAPYEAPAHPEIVVRTDEQSVEESVHQILSWLREKRYIGPAQ